MKNKTVILIIVLAMAFALVFAACQTNDADKTPSGDNNTSGDINSGDIDLPSGEITSGDVDLPSGDTEEPETIEVDYQEYMQEVLTKLENEEGLVYNNLSTWSTARQDALKEYLDTNYGEQFMTGDRSLDNFQVKEIVGYDFDFENNAITALIQAQDPYASNTFQYKTRKIELNNSLNSFFSQYLTNNDIKQKYGDLTNNYEDKEGNITVFVNNGQIVDFSTMAILDGTYKTSSIFASITINQSRDISYSPSEFSALITQYNWMFAEEGYSLSTVYSATKASQPHFTENLGKSGQWHTSIGIGLDTKGNFVKFQYGVETLDDIKSFLDITPTSTYAKLNEENSMTIFGNGNTIVRVECLESES